MKIKIENYNKVIKGTPILTDVNLTLEGGQVYGLKGINGSGKTMLMRAICGFIYPTSGSITIDGELLGKEISFPRSIGALIENPAFVPNYTGYENLQLISSIKKIASATDIAKSLKLVGLEPDDKRIYKKFSLGMKQKLGIAAAIFENPEIVILDEPLNALDEESVNKFKEIIRLLKQTGALIIIACHDSMELEEMSDQIICVEAGRIKGIQNKAGEVSHEE